MLRLEECTGSHALLLEIWMSPSQLSSGPIAASSFSRGAATKKATAFIITISPGAIVSSWFERSKRRPPGEQSHEMAASDGAAFIMGPIGGRATTRHVPQVIEITQNVS